MTQPASIQLLSPSKLNVFLEVHGKRDDGYHELETVMLRTSLCDVMKFDATTSDRLSLRLVGHPTADVRDSFPLDNSNLILRAAEALRLRCGVEYGSAIFIDKRIPAQAGLAGGSANAATTLITLNQLWDLRLQRSELHEIAASLGSDINFFIEGSRAAICRGRGELVESIPLNQNLWAVLARPTVGNRTPEVFSQLQFADQRRSVEQTIASLRLGTSALVSRASFNRLTRSAMELNNAMAELMTKMARLCNRPVHMTGSGSTCFVLARSAREASRIRAQLTGLELAFLSTAQV